MHFMTLIQKQFSSVVLNAIVSITIIIIIKIKIKETEILKYFPNLTFIPHPVGL